MQSGFSRADRPALLAIGALALVATGVGFRAFEFLTDDAFIAFRYVGNHQLGRGFVWNPAPFLPVEGYTSWLWIAILDVIWTWTGVEPPDAANLVSLGLGVATLAVCAAFLARMPLPDPLARWRVAWLALALLGAVSNRTFLTWLSSGLETALFNFAVTVWLYFALAPNPDGRRGPALGHACAAAAAALTRPDGLLLVGGSGLLLGVEALRARSAGALGRAFLPAVPLAAVPAHLLWRFATYGEWLPNSYYAKVRGPWPEAGWRYAGSFVLEYAVWIWLALALAWLVRATARGDLRRTSLRAWVAVAVIAGHLGYYTLLVGGDHFEYRVYSYTVPLLFVSSVWLGARLALRPAALAAALALFVAASWPLPWTHWAITRRVENPVEGVRMAKPVAPSLPAPLGPYARAFDELQAWLIAHDVCLRHQSHVLFYEFWHRVLPSREEGAEIGWDGRPVIGIGGVGLVGWRLPHVAVIDVLGLNDWVVARTEGSRYPERQMAHDRKPPPGYVECFRPNVRDLEGIRVYPREEPLTDAEIVACERRFRGNVGR